MNATSMRRRELRRLFVRILVNSAPVAMAASGCVFGEDGGSTTEPCTPLQRIYSVGLSDPTLGPLLEACIANNTAKCKDLCQALEPRSLINVCLLLPTSGSATEAGVVDASEDVATDAEDPDAGSPTVRGVLVGRQGIAATDCPPDGIGGRRPLGFAENISADEVNEEPEAAWFARAARLEAASVYAFEQLARQLLKLGAPRALVRSARRSAGEELRHAALMAAFCDAREVPHDLEVEGDEISLEDLAVHNAVEGCVRETFGALIATRQALVAHGQDRRAAFREIANDETRHAELAWKIHHWAMRRLAPSARARISRAQRAAVAQLAEIGVPMPRDVAANLGLPGPRESRRLLRELEVALWAA